MVKSSRLPEVGELPNLFQDTSLASPKLSVMLFKDLGIINGSSYTTSQAQTQPSAIHV